MNTEVLITLLEIAKFEDGRGFYSDVEYLDGNPQLTLYADLIQMSAALSTARAGHYEFLIRSNEHGTNSEKGFKVYVGDPHTVMALIAAHGMGELVTVSFEGRSTVKITSQNALAIMSIGIQAELDPAQVIDMNGVYTMTLPWLP